MLPIRLACYGIRSVAASCKRINIGTLSQVRMLIFVHFLLEEINNGLISLVQVAREFSSDERPQFPGSRSQWTEKLEFIRPDLYDGIPVYRVMDRKGKVIDPSQDPQVK